MRRANASGSLNEVFFPRRGIRIRRWSSSQVALLLSPHNSGVRTVAERRNQEGALRA